MKIRPKSPAGVSEAGAPANQCCGTLFTAPCAVQPPPMGGRGSIARERRAVSPSGPTAPFFDSSSCEGLQPAGVDCRRNRRTDGAVPETRSAPPNAAANVQRPSKVVVPRRSVGGLVCEVMFPARRPATLFRRAQQTRNAHYSAAVPTPPQTATDGWLPITGVPGQLSTFTACTGDRCER
jgi:hypothetical protein